MKSIRKRLLHGFGANSFGQFANILIQIISVPLFIKFWGVKLYGEWLILSTIPAYLAMSDMGFSSVAANEMTMKVAESNKNKALETFQSVWIFISSVCLLLIVLMPIFWFIPLKNGLNIVLLTHDQVALIAILLSLSVVVGLQGGLLSAGFRCDGNYALGTWISNLSRLFEFGAVLVGVYLGIEPLGAAVIVLVARALSFFISRLFLQNISPWIVYGYRWAALDKIRQMALPSLAFMAFPVGNAIKNQGMLTIVGIMLGPVAVVAFSTLRTLTNSALQVMGMINNTVWPEMSMAYGAGNMELARKLHRYSCQISFWLSLLAIISLAFLGEWIIRVWTLGKVTMDPVFFHLMLLVIFANSIWFTSSIVPAAINKHEKMALYYLAGTGFSFALAGLLVSIWHLSGVAVALLATDVLMTIYVINASLKVLDDRFIDFTFFVITPSVKTVLTILRIKKR